MNSDVPCVSFAIPVRNGERYIGRLLDSILAQTFQDFEVVISDNASTDLTAEIVEQYCARDPRIRYYRNASDLGQLENFNRVFDLSKGVYLRWIGVDDWLEPDYTKDCLDVLEKNPTLIGVTTYTVMHHDGGSVQRFEYEGERLQSENFARRFSRLMWLLTKGLMYLSLLSAMFRRDVLVKVGKFGIEPDTDFVMCARLGLAGPFGHIAKHHVHRRRPVTLPAERFRLHIDYAKRYHPTKYTQMRHSYWQSGWKVIKIIWSSGLSLRESILCSLALQKFLFWKIPRDIIRSIKTCFLRCIPSNCWLFLRMNRSSGD